jgi:hypothetical protein
MPRHHVVISGTGRAGTTFLVQLLGRLGLETGVGSGVVSGLDGTANAGLECDIRRSDAPYVVKAPHMCETLEAALADGEVVVDRALVPVRDLYEAAESRRDVLRRSHSELPPQLLAGGLFGTDDPAAQEAALATRLYQLIHTLAKHDVPTTLLHFPRLVEDPEYLFRKLWPVLPPDTEYAGFVEAFRDLSKPELVHRFPTAQGRAEPPGD